MLPCLYSNSRFVENDGGTPSDQEKLDHRPSIASSACLPGPPRHHLADELLEWHRCTWDTVAAKTLGRLVTERATQAGRASLGDDQHGDRGGKENELRVRL